MTGSVRNTLSIHNFLCVTHERCMTTLGGYIQLLSIRPKVLRERSQRSSPNSPSVLRPIFVKQGMHDLHGLVSQLVGFDNTWWSDAA